MPRHQVDDNFAVHRRLKNRAAAFQLFAKLLGVDDIAVMGEGIVVIGKMGQKRLGIGKNRGTGGGIADMSDSQIAGEFFQVGFLKTSDTSPIPL